jgi:hypothetical protein
MVISMVVIMAAVIAWVAMVPRVREISRPAVDATSVALQVRQDTGWPISAPHLPAGWKATNARFESSAGGVRTWHAGYLSPDGQYLSIDQTEVRSATPSWVAGRTANGRAEGTLAAAGTTWRKLSSPDIVQRSLVSTGTLSSGPGSKAPLSKGSGESDLTTVLSGTAPYAELAQFARDLRPVPNS